MELNIKVPCTDEEIKTEISILNAKIKEREIELKTLRLARECYQEQCSHKGQKTGCNERDGSWGNPCPICGYSF